MTASKSPAVTSLPSNLPTRKLKAVLKGTDHGKIVRNTSPSYISSNVSSKGKFNRKVHSRGLFSFSRLWLWLGTKKHRQQQKFPPSAVRRRRPGK